MRRIAEYSHKEKVVVVNTTDKELDGRQGEILGLAQDFPEGKFYIVGFDEPLERGWSAIVLTEHCLEPVDLLRYMELV